MSDIIAEREKTHGPWEHTAVLSRRMKALIAQELIVERYQPAWLTHCQLEAIDMILTKLARIVVGDPRHADHWLDISKYAELGMRDCSE